jgi:glycosyltransferase involved in cell wall biosynthesis
VILSMVDFYLPGYKGGGPITTLAGMVERLGRELRFRVVTRDRDLGDAEPYPGVSGGTAHAVGQAEVVYLAPGALSLRGVRAALRAAPYDVLYLNSFFSPRLTLQPLLLRRARLLPDRPVVVAPRGEFSPGALALKAPKKRAFIAAARAAGLYRGVLWQASAGAEADDIRRWFPDAEIRVAPDLAPEPAAAAAARTPKEAGRLRAVFLSRISPKKNLLGALRALAEVRGPVELEVYGPAEDAAYWDECRREIERLPPHVTVHVRGAVTPVQVPAALAGGHVLLLPTLGENFGHVVLEALLAGTLPLLSDRTPWRGLEARGVGWDLPLEEPHRLVEALERCRAMDPDEFGRWSARAAAFGRESVRDPAAVDANRELFRAALARGVSEAAPGS